MLLQSTHFCTRRSITQHHPTLKLCMELSLWEVPLGQAYRRRKRNRKKNLKDKLENALDRLESKIREQMLAEQREQRWRVLNLKNVHRLQEKENELRARKQAVQAKKKEFIRREEVLKEKEAALFKRKHFCRVYQPSVRSMKRYFPTRS